MFRNPPPLHQPPAAGGKTSGCARAALILILGVLMVSILTYVTRKSPEEEASETVAEAPASLPEIPRIVDVPAIAGQDSGEVMRVLGEPTSQQATKNGQKAVYKDGLVEVVFIGGKADWITVTPANDVPFDKKALIILGIPAAEPTESTANFIRWEPCGDYLSVSVFPKDGNRIDYAYIKVATK